MTSRISRRDFLKLGGLMPISLASPQLFKLLGAFGQANTAGQNVLVVVFDAFSGLNIPLNGYIRETTPNLSRLAKRAIVYHNHYAGSNFTTPGTASLLTGTLPWTHRAQAKTGSSPFRSRTLAFSATTRRFPQRLGEYPGYRRDYGRSGAVADAFPGDMTLPGSLFS
jgi:hypothetical protein